MPTALLQNRLFVDEQYVTPEILSAYEYDCTENSLPLRIKTWRYNNGLYGFCRGDLRKLKRVFSGFDIDDRRAVNPWPDTLRDFRFTGILEDDQLRAVTIADRLYGGTVKAPPRWGKTVASTELICRKRQYTLILTHRKDLAKQWIETFHDMTNCRDVERHLGRPIVRLAENALDIEAPITIMTYQSLLYDLGKAVLSRYRNYWGLILVDESHRTTAEGFSRVLNSLNPRERYGVTATPYDSRNQQHCITHDILGPVIVEGLVEPPPCLVTIVNDGIAITPGNKWITWVNHLVRSERRNRFIVERVAQDVAEGRHVLITTDRRDHCEQMPELLRSIMPGRRFEYVHGDVPQFSRDIYRHDFRAGKISGLVAMNSIVQEGYNVPRCSKLHNTCPLTDAELWYQRSARPRTRYTKDEASRYGPYDKPMAAVDVYMSPNEHGMQRAYLQMVEQQSQLLGMELQRPSSGRRRL